MRRRLRSLEEPYRSRAVPPGSERYWSWLFASPETREPLLGMYALMAEWRALMDPKTEGTVARIKLAWWRDEIRRLADHSPAHPITRFVADLPLASAVDLASLELSVQAAATQVAGAPLEHASELAAHSFSLYGIPLVVAGNLAGKDDPGTGSGTTACIADLATAEYLARTSVDYRGDVHIGRVPFPVDELLAGHIENADLAALEPPPALQRYLSELRQRTARHLADAARVMHTVAPAIRRRQRHLEILAALGAKHVKERRALASTDFRLSDLYNAWITARRAVRGG